MKKTVAALALLACANSFAVTVDIEVKAFQKVLFEKVSSNTLKKIHASMELEVTGVVKQDGKTVTINESQPAQYDRNTDMKIIIVDKHSVRLIDEADGIDEVVTAKIKKSFTGKIKDLVIDKDIYQSLYNKQLEQFGGGIFGQFGVASDNEAFSVELALSDFDCIKEYDGMVECHQTLTFKMSGSDEVAGSTNSTASSTKAEKEIDAAIAVADSYIPNLISSTKYGISSYITVITEVSNELIYTSSNISGPDARRAIESIRNDIQAEIMDSYSYTTASGQYISDYLKGIKTRLESTKKLL
ncbi:hypothetical protein A9Q84_10320 [Halobacteriovorax marinus]|uniref:Lipoprotein n=1 Tax=Halobacteriovorax marinus TaxID=97084 RepID=A0A1Y5F763_9BACT|nr:hypothetical protein A9Q84_10320 [Halobacteriovorax marinus]